MKEMSKILFPLLNLQLCATQDINIFLCFYSTNFQVISKINIKHLILTISVNEIVYIYNNEVGQVSAKKFLSTPKKFFSKFFLEGEKDKSKNNILSPYWKKDAKLFIDLDLKSSNKLYLRKSQKTKLIKRTTTFRNEKELQCNKWISKLYLTFKIYNTKISEDACKFFET
ncbi:hypothetical protein RFI_29218 [Reticulomyxa filosa]|uniref:Uncharacterized protein n=1 Tax=Reticulomyxa filosa TaxID=46433 RepID=X6M3F7_RETFI|nr:hypothetical protein RFI_29218 [Reticulomyxa filosa]|eukprot:ETO08171.1 hypothetical protein RFI_29218 [Reticulomyxa filosa]